MKAYDSYSTRGIVFAVLGLTGICIEIIRKPVEPLIILLYGLVVIIGAALLFWMKSREA